MAPSSPFAAWQPLWGSSLTEPRSGVRVLEEAAFTAVIAAALIESSGKGINYLYLSSSTTVILTSTRDYGAYGRSTGL